MRTHVEVDPRVGLRSFDAIRRLKRDYAWAIDLEICVFPQEGLLNDPGTDELLVAACEAGADLIGGCPYTDTRSARADRAHLRDRAALRSRYRFSSRLRSRCRPGWISTRSAGRPTAHPLWRARRGRPCHQAVGAAARPAGRNGAAACGRRRRRHGAAGDRPVPDGPRAMITTFRAASRRRTGCSSTA